MDQSESQHERPDTGERRIARLIELSAPGIWDWDFRANKFLVTARLRDIFGFKAADVVDMAALVDATHPDDQSWAEVARNSDDDAPNVPVLSKFRIRRADTGAVRWISARIWANRENAPAVSGYSGTVEDVTDEMATAAALAASEERLRLAIEAGKMAVWEVDLESGAMTQSTELNVLCGFEPNATINIQDVRALYNPGEIERLAQEQNTVEAVRKKAVSGAYEPRQAGALKSGADRTQVQAEVAITTRAGVPKRLMLRAQYAVSPEGRPRLTGLLVDITETKMAEERLAVVARELQHRVKNLLSVIHVIAVQSLRGKADAQAGLEAFRGRLGALAAANDLILARDSSAADLHDLIEKITRPYYSGTAIPFLLEGTAAHLQPHAATSLGMVLHELCTNAVKYGALSVPGGEVSIQWRQESQGQLALTWQERNGPSVTTPNRRGFGSRLIENILGGQLKGRVAVDFRPEGVRCSIEMRSDH